MLQGIKRLFPTDVIYCSFLNWSYFYSLSEEFTRAVYVATGIKLTRHLVNTVFKIFDEDRDGKLSHKEFIGVMKDRLHRGDGVRQQRSFECHLCLFFMTTKVTRCAHQASVLLNLSVC